MKLWTGVLEASIAGGICILVFYIITTLCQKKYKSRYKKTVWIFIALRLLIPLNTTAFPQLFTIEIPAMEFGKNENNDLSEAKNTLENEKVRTVEKTDRRDVPKTTGAKGAVTTEDILIVIWGGGIFIFFLHYFVSYLVTKKKIMQQSRECTDENVKHIISEIALEMKIKGIPTIRVLENSDNSPFTIGIIENVIFLPDQHYMETDLRYIIKHELIHCREKDVLGKAIILGINVIHWFNPLVWWMRKLVEQDMELICDEELLKGASAQERKDYSEVIMSCIETQPGRKSVLTTGYVQGSKYLKWRFTNIFNDHKKNNGYFIVGGMVLILIFAGQMVHIREGETIHFSKKNSIDFGYEIRTDIDGDGNVERVHVSDNVSGTNAFTQIAAQYNNGKNIHIDYPDYWSSYLVSGDLSSNGAADIVVVRISTGSTYGGGVVSVLHVDEGEWKEYSSVFIKNPALKIEQPDNFSEDNWDVSCLAATVIKEGDKMLLRLILNEDIGNDIVKCIDTSYTENGWYIENIQIVSDYYAENKDQELLYNNFH